MKKIKLTFLTILFVIGLMAGSAQAGGPGNHGGPGRGYYGGPVHGNYGGPGRGNYGGPWWRGYYGGWWWPGIYWGGLALSGLPWSYNYYPRTPMAVQQDQVYVQQQDNYYWYYCENPKGYYPYISSCPSGWTKVVPNANPQTAPPN